MNSDYTDIALDADGIPILTDLVTDRVDAPDSRDNDPSHGASRSPAKTAHELLESEAVQQMLNQMASNIASDVRLQVEQTLAGAIDDAINRVMEKSGPVTYEHIRQQLHTALPDLIATAIQAQDD